MFVLDLTVFLVYDTMEDQWTKLERPVTPVRCSAVVFSEEKLIASGGLDDGWISCGLIQTYDIDNKKWSLVEETMPYPLWDHSAFVMELPRTLTDRKLKPQTLSMKFLVKTFAMVVVSLGLAWCMYFIYRRCFGY